MRPADLRTLFQPIVAGSAAPPRLVAFECLTRGPAGSSLESAAELFTYMREHGLEAGIDRACVACALETARTHGLRQLLFVNVHAVTFHRDPGFVPFLIEATEARGLSATQLVIEVVEHDREQCPQETDAALRMLARAGVASALDDFGANLADARLVRLWSPRYVKLDGNLLRWARRSTAARQVIEATVADVTRRRGEVIAEGLEHEGDLELATRLGIGLHQGFAIARPLIARDAAATGRRARRGRAVLPPTRNDGTDGTALR